MEASPAPLGAGGTFEATSDSQNPLDSIIRKEPAAIEAGYDRTRRHFGNSGVEALFGATQQGDWANLTVQKIANKLDLEGLISVPAS